MIERFNRQFLTMAGYSEKEISQFRGPIKSSRSKHARTIQKKSMRASLDGNGKHIILLR